MAVKCQERQPHPVEIHSIASEPFATMEAAPKKAATSLRDLATSALDSAKTREVSMALPNPNRHHHLTESQAALPPGHWVVRRGVQVFVREKVEPHVPGRRTCHCGKRYRGPSCKVCLEWAEKDARLHAEAQQSWANRNYVWDVLELRKQVAA